MRPNLFDRRGRRNQKEILNRMVNVKRMLMPLRVSREGYHDTAVMYIYMAPTGCLSRMVECNPM